MPPFDFDPRNDGLWGDTTSTLDWCEHNYEVSWLSAGHCRPLGINMDLVAAKLVYSGVLQHSYQSGHDSPRTIWNVHCKET